jgi:hypothetical protein
MMDKERNVALDVAKLIADLPPGKTLRTSEIRTGGKGWGESGTKRFYEFARKAQTLYGRSHYYEGNGRYVIAPPLKWVCRKYVREHQN